LSTFSLNGIKLIALGLIWLIILLPGISVFIIWHYLGGSICFPEILTLLLGHTLYGLTIASIAMFATAVSNSLPTAAMICLGTTLGSWVLDFTTTKEGWLKLLDNWSFTPLLRQFENGLLSSNAVISFFSLSLLFFIAASIWIHPGQRFYSKIKTLLLAVGAVALVTYGAARIPHYIDVTENRQHSFNPADVQALQQMEKPLKITIHLSPEDGRLYDLEHEVLSKLRRIVPRLHLIFASSGTSGLFDSAVDDNYGLIEYEYDGRFDKSYSNSPEEILPLLYALAGQNVTPETMQKYAGHPLVTDASGGKWWFYLILPTLFLFTGYLIRHSQYYFTFTGRS
jgi:hypothetical protein